MSPLAGLAPSARLGHAIAALRPRLDRALVGEDAFRRLRALGDRMPADLTDVLYLEVRLAPRSPDVDLVFEVARPARHHLLAIDAAHPSWRAVERLAAAWRDGRSAATRSIHHLWLEFDLPAAGPEPVPPVPGVFVCFGEARPAEYRLASWGAHVLESLALLDASRLTGPLADRIAHCLDAAPAAAYLPYVGVMLGRAEAGVRLCFTGVPDADVIPFLSRVGWAGEPGEVAAHVRELAATQPEGPLRGAGMLHLDVTANGPTRLGIEFACRRKPQLHGELAERALLNRLVASGLCTAAKRRALLRWPGASAVRLPGEPHRRALIRRLNHVKLVYRPGEPPEAKAYLGTWSVPLPAEPLHPSGHPSTPTQPREAGV